MKCGGEAQEAGSQQGRAAEEGAAAGRWGSAQSGAAPVAADSASVSVGGGGRQIYSHCKGWGQSCSHCTGNEGRLCRWHK